jgi:hypothetical protein
MGSFKDVTPAEIEAAYQGLKKRVPVYSEAAALAAAVVARPDLAVQGLQEGAIAEPPAVVVAGLRDLSRRGCACSVTVRWESNPAVGPALDNERRQHPPVDA